MNAPIFNLDALIPGDLLCRYTPDFIGSVIRRATGGKWNHDALYLGDGLVGDALWGGDASENDISEWEDSCVSDGCKVVVLRAIGITKEGGTESASWWIKNVCGRPYDYWALAQLGWSALWGRVDKAKFGAEASFYCTESCAEALHCGAGLKPWWPKLINPTPGTTYKRLTQRIPTFFQVHGAFTAFGMKYKIAI